MTRPLSIDLPDELLDALAERVAERLAAQGFAGQAGDEWLRGADAIADHIGCKRDRIYQLRSSGRIGCIRQDGSALVAKRSELDAWLRDGGGKRP